VAITKAATTIVEARMRNNELMDICVTPCSSYMRSLGHGVWVRLRAVPHSASERIHKKELWGGNNVTRAQIGGADAVLLLLLLFTTLLAVARVPLCGPSDRRSGVGEGVF
jgi:hypothetical protein